MKLLNRNFEIHNFIDYLKFLLIAITIFSGITFVVTIWEASHLDRDWSKDGLIVFIEQFKGFYGLYGGNIVLISVYYWMRQIGHIENNDKRLDIDKAVSEVRYFSSEILPVTDKFFQDLKPSFPVLVSRNWNCTDFSSESMEKQGRVSVLKDLKVIEGHGTYNQIRTKILYKLEAFSTIVLHGKIDQNLLFEALGEEYCKLIEKLYPFICYYRSIWKGYNKFNNTINLYKKWHPGIVQHDLKK